MPALNETLDAIGRELAGLIKMDDPKPEPATVAMTANEFLAYAADQIEKAKTDADPKARLEALIQAVSIAKAQGWQDQSTMSFPVFSGPESVSAGSRQAEIIADHPGMGIGIPAPQAAPSHGAFESTSGPSGPATNTVAPAARIMPPGGQQSEPAGNGKGFMAKAEGVLKSAGAEGAVLLEELKAMLDAESPGDESVAVAPVAKNEDWPADCATEEFLAGKEAVQASDDFGLDPRGLGRGKILRD